MERVVVGIDGSAASVAALAWAARYASATGSQLVLVHTYDPPDVPLGAEHELLESDPEILEHAAFRYLEALALRHGLAQADVVVVRDRLPARALIAHAADANLLVVGHRGRRGFAHLVLGSVSQQCVHNAVCPVTVVPPVRQVEEPAAVRRAAAGLAARP